MLMFSAMRAPFGEMTSFRGMFLIGYAPSFDTSKHLLVQGNNILEVL